MYSIEQIEEYVRDTDAICGDGSMAKTACDMLRQLLAERSQIRRQAFEEAAEIADYGYDGYGKNLPSTRAICMTIADMIRRKAEGE